MTASRPYSATARDEVQELSCTLYATGKFPSRDAATVAAKAMIARRKEKIAAEKRQWELMTMGPYGGYCG